MKSLAELINIKRLIALLLCAVMLCAFSSCGNAPEKPNENEQTAAPESTQAEKNETQPAQEAAKSPAEKILENMTLEEKVGQLFMLDPGMLTNDFNTSQATQQALELTEKYNIGGFIFFKPNIQTPEQTRRLIADLQSAPLIKPFFGVDEEGGIVSRIGSNPEMGMKKQPAMEKIGASGDSSLAYQVGSELAEGLKGFGFNLDFAPVADVNTNPDNPVIGSRAFGSEPELVAEMVAQEVIGMQEGGVSACLKHFPGHGDTATDTHTGFASVSHDAQRLREVELVPFKAGIDAGADMIMVAHISLPNVTDNDEPASISPKIVNGILREEMGYNGVVITDSMVMQALYDKYTFAQASVLSLKAGVDILLFQTPGTNDRGTPKEQFEAAYRAVLTAVDEGELTEERINESVLRILELKLKRGIITE